MHNESRRSFADTYRAFIGTWTALAALVLLSSPVFVQAATPAERLEAEIARIAAGTKGEVGVAMRRIGSDTTIGYNLRQRFPMASTFKIAVAGATLAMAERNEITLQEMVMVDPLLVVPSDGIDKMARHHPGVMLSVLNLINLALTVSDNTATDVLLSKIGGVDTVNDWLKSIGIKGQRVDSNVAHLLYRAYGVKPGEGSYRQNIQDAARERRATGRKIDVLSVRRRFAADPRDSSTPLAMVDLLEKIQTGAALGAEATHILLDIMDKATSGKNRLAGRLPENTPVAHKTGTLAGMANDAGLVELPDGSKFAIAVFIKLDEGSLAARERIIANISRAAYDYYLYF